SQGPLTFALANTSFAPSRSWMFARWTTTASTKPRVSTRMCRLTPLIFFPRVVPPRAAGPGRLDGLTVETAGARLGLLTDVLAHLASQRVVDPLPVPRAAPPVEVVPHRPFGG